MSQFVAWTRGGVECRSSREFAEALGYSDLRNFQAVLDKAKLARLNSGQAVEDHFAYITEMIQVGKSGSEGNPRRDAGSPTLQRYFLSGAT